MCTRQSRQVHTYVHTYLIVTSLKELFRNMGYDQYPVPDNIAVEPTLVASFSTYKHTSMTSLAISSNFFEER